MSNQQSQSSFNQNTFKEGICLALDSATEMLSLACGYLHRGGSLEILAADNRPAPRKANVELLVRIDAMLKSANLNITDMDTIVAGQGPGSFTGVRIGVATAKGLSAALGCPLFGVSTLDAIAHQAWHSSVRGKIAVIGDAMRKEIYPVRYLLENVDLAGSMQAGGQGGAEDGAQGSKQGGARDDAENNGQGDAQDGAQSKTQSVVRLDPYMVAKPEDITSKFAAEKEELLCLGNGLIKYRDIFEEAGYNCADESLWVPTGEGMLYAFAQSLNGNTQGLAIDDCLKTQEGVAQEPQTNEAFLGNPATLLPIYTRLSDAEENERIAHNIKDNKIPANGVAHYDFDANAKTDDPGCSDPALKTDSPPNSADANPTLKTTRTSSNNTNAAKTSPLILSIESSCDETAAAVLNGNREVLSNVVASQIDFHARFGGVVPEIASRKHIEAIVTVAAEALEQANIGYKDLDAIAVTQGPGLVGCLVVGLAFAKGAAYALDLPIIGVNHLEGHLYANLFVDPKIEPPFIALLVSGGHTMLVHVKAWGSYEVIGSTLDDAVGEAFDKVAKALKLGYPGGPILSRLAKEGDKQAIRFPRAMMHSKDLSFSLSGLKTAVITYIKQQNDAGIPINLPNLAASFQAAVIDVQVSKALTACKSTNTHLLCLGGGVAANAALREALKTELGKHNIRVLYPNLADCGDNAAMIGAVACDLYKKQQFVTLDADPIARMHLNS